MKGPLKIDYEQLWQQGMHDWQGRMPERMVDDQLEEDFWMQSIQRKALGQTDAHAIPIFNEMKPYFTKGDSCLEIGPGWGNYTFPIQKIAGQLTLVDGSESILTYLKSFFLKANVSFIHAKWEQAAADPHDIVIGVNCFYRMYDILGALRKMNALAKKRVIIGMTTGPIQPHYPLLEEKYGYLIKYPRRDYVTLINLLYQMGIYADCKVLRLERTYRYGSMKELVQAQSKKVLSPDFEEKHIVEALQPFIKKENGGYIYHHPFHAAVISWKPKPLSHM